jgi:L-lactate dehydrogenase (cytochrome)
VPFHLLEDAVKQIGKDAEVHLDTGIMHGQDIIAAIAKGAKFTMVGRAYLYGLMAGGREGVDKMISILSSEMTRTMKLLGARSLDELEPGHVKILEKITYR